MSTPESRLDELGITLPEPMKPVATYVPYVMTGNLLFISGQVSATAEGRMLGRLGENMELSAGQQAARQCGINLIAQMRAACEGDLDRVVRVVKLGGFVQAAQDFTAIPQVVNGASDLMVEAFGDAGRHARSAVGVYRLPMNFAVEVDAVVAVR